MLKVEKAAVLGAGTMGAAIAAHLSNAGIPTLLLDIASPDAGDSKAERDALVKSMFEAAKKLKPAPFMLGDNAKLIEIGNFTDDMEKLKDCDFVIEAVVERLDIKHKLFAEVEKHRKPTAVIASNTSGIPIASIAEPFSDDFKKHFVGIHFFNPPRYMKLVEVIPTAGYGRRNRLRDQRFSGSAFGQRRCSGERSPEFYRQPHRRFFDDGDDPRNDRDGFDADRS